MRGLIWAKVNSIVISLHRALFLCYFDSIPQLNYKQISESFNHKRSDMKAHGHPILLRQCLLEKSEQAVSR